MINLCIIYTEVLLISTRKLRKLHHILLIMLLHTYHTLIVLNYY